MPILLFISAAALFLCSTVLASFGINWIEVGHGLHPLIAFPAAALAAVLSHQVTGLAVEYDNQ